MDASIPVSVPAIFFLMAAILLLVYAFLRSRRRGNGNSYQSRRHRTNAPPHLPPRGNSASSRPAPSRPPISRGSPPPVPPRTARTSNSTQLRPSEYPICPFCRQRNSTHRQVIFWDDSNNRYNCTMGHIFGKNGKPIT